MTTIFLHFTLASVAFRIVKDNPRLVIFLWKIWYMRVCWQLENWNYDAIHEAEKSEAHTYIQLFY